MVSSSNVVSAAPCPPEGRLLTLFPCSSMQVSLMGDSSPQTSTTGCSSSETAPVWVPPTGCSSSQHVPEWGPSTGCSPGTKAAPAWVRHGVTSPARKPALAWPPLSTGLKVLPGACFSTGLPTGSQLHSGIHLLHRGVPSMGYRWISAPPWTSKDCTGTTCLTMVFIMNCKGRLSAPTFI